MRTIAQLTVYAAVITVLSMMSACSTPAEPSKAALPRIKVKSGLDTQSGVVRLQVEVPPGHHAYTDAGDSGNLIPVTFQWDHLHKESGISGPLPELVSDPPGSRDEEFQARVLRGSGLFEFKAENVQKYSGQILSVRSQICDEKTGICYRPETVQITLTN